MTEPVMEGHHDRENQLFNENVLLQSKVDKLERELLEWKQLAKSYQQRNHFMFNTIKEMTTKEKKA